MKATVGIAVWTDKETCSITTMYTSPCSVYSNSMWHWPYWTRWISLKHRSGQHCFHKGIPNAQYPCGRSFPTVLRYAWELMQYSISQSDNNACDILIEYAGGIKHINGYIHRLISTLQPLGKQKTAYAPASEKHHCVPTGVLLPLWSDY